MRQTIIVCIGILVLGISFGSKAQSSSGLPEGDMQPMVQAVCSACHGVNLITRSTGYSPNDWRLLVTGMVDVPEPHLSRMVNYLAENFPYTPGSEPTIVEGSYSLEIREWRVPTLGQRPRDPFMDEQGNIWWAGMWASLIGRFNPETGDVQEWQLDPSARPHSILPGPDGNVWYTGNGNGTMGKLNPETGEITVYPMPDPAARDPHTGYFADDGMLWFTLQHSNMVGRLDPQRGDVDLITMPTDSARPYGIKQDSSGMIWVAYNGANGLARISPDDMRVTEFKNSTPDTHIRRLAIDSNDLIWYVDSGRGYVGRLNPATGEFREWASPSGPTSHPYAMEIVDDVIWYNESGMRPDALVRFDPQSETFQSWVIPSGVGIIRHMRVTPDGDIAIHQSSTNTIGLAILPE
ncbi:MAG: cytochrome C [Porticoccaceae bacterium]